MWHAGFHGHSHESTVDEPNPAALFAEQEAMRVAALRLHLGEQYCSARGCEERTGLPCVYVDRRQRHCPTAWCPQHRFIAQGQVHCHVHASLVEGTADTHGEVLHPDIENRAPALVNFVAREVNKALMQRLNPLARECDQLLVVDPVRFVRFGVGRVRTWDRSWKMCSPQGVDLRVAVVVEELRPDVVIGRVNSRTVVELPAPWHEEHQIGVEPSNDEEGSRAVQEFHTAMVTALSDAINVWHAQEYPAHMEHKARSLTGAIEAHHLRESPAPSIAEMLPTPIYHPH